MSKSKHETTGLTPEPASRKLRTDDDKEVEKQEEDKPDHPMHADPMTRLVLEELQSEMAGLQESNSLPYGTAFGHTPGKGQERNSSGRMEQFQA